MRSITREIKREPQDILRFYRLHIGQEFADTLSDEIAGQLDIPAAIKQIEAANNIAIDQHHYETLIQESCLPCELILNPAPFNRLLCFEFWDDITGQWVSVDPSTYRVIPAGLSLKPGIIRRTNDWPTVGCRNNCTGCCDCDCWRIQWVSGYAIGGPATSALPADLIKTIALVAENLSGVANPATERAIANLRQSTNRPTVHSYL